MMGPVEEAGWAPRLHGLGREGLHTATLQTNEGGSRHQKKIVNGFEPIITPEW